MITVIHVSIFAFIILVMLIILKINGYGYEGFENENENKPTTSIVSNEIPKLKRPFVNLFDQQGRKLNIFFISKPFSGDEQNKIYLNNKDGNIYLGISSYLEFPNEISNPFEDFTKNYEKYRYKEITKGWIHCFRNPKDYFAPEMPLLFASESDWTDCNFIKPNPEIKDKKYDFIYICLKVNEKLDKCDDWATFNKNWALAQKCLDVMCNKYKLKGLLIGRKGCKLPEGCHDLMETTNMVKYGELRKLYQQSRFIFLPNEKDASPRVLTEALCMNVPTLINKNILGGWKYINEKTGQFFTDENDVGQNIEIIMNKIKNNEYEPRKYFVENYGPIKSGKKLKQFLYSNWGKDINLPEHEVEYITPEFPKKDFKQCVV